jgi:hypothetical protein
LHPQEKNDQMNALLRLHRHDAPLWAILCGLSEWRKDVGSWPIMGRLQLFQSFTRKL